MLPRWLQRRALQVFSLQPGQGRRTFLTALYLCLIIASYLMLRSAARSLFIQRFGAVGLPYPTIVTAVTAALAATAYVSLSRRFEPVRLIVTIQAVLVSNLLAFWWLADAYAGAVPVLYVWIMTYGVVAPTQVWILANYLFTTREAKRVFGVVGAGGIVGGMLGGTLTGLLAPVVGTTQLLLVAAGLLTVATGIVLSLRRHRLPVQARVDDRPPPAQILESLRLITASRHLRMIGLIVMASALATKTVEWQFSAVAEVAFPGEDARTSFFGAFDAFTGVGGLLFQILLTSRLLMWMGLGGTVLIFPAVLTTATLGSLVPAISKWAAGLARASDQMLKHSIDRASRELLYLPVSRAVKVQAKSTIDMMADRLGDGISGLVQLAVIFTLGAFGATQLGMIRGMGLVNLLFLAGWIALAVRLRKSYVDELGSSIEEGRVRFESWIEVLAGAETVAAVRSALESEDESRVRAALDLVAANPELQVRDTLCRLAREGTPEVRARALAVLLDPSQPGLPEGVTGAFETEDQALLADLIDLQMAEEPVEREQRARRILARAGGSARGAWIALLVRRLGPEFRPVARVLLEELLRSGSPSTARVVAATAIGMIPAESGMADLLPPLLADADPRVVAAAARSSAAIGREDLLAGIVPLLHRPSTARIARVALQSRGDDSVRVLREASRDASLDRRSRLRIPAVLAGIESAEALQALTDLLRSADRELAEAAGEALFRIRLKHPNWSLLPPREARELTLVQARACARLRELKAALEQDAPPEDRPSWRLLLASIEAAYVRGYESIFRMLCLHYPPRDILNCRKSLLDRSRERRHNAAELLDNLVPRRLWRELVPILVRDEAVPPVASTGGVRGQILASLANGRDPWLKACSIHVSGELGLAPPPVAVAGRGPTEHPWVREAVERAGSRAGEGEGGAVSSMSVVEKVVALQDVEVFRGTPPEQLALIASVAREQTFPAGATLCRQDDPPGDMYVLLDGKVAVDRDGGSLGALGRGDALGTWALFEEEPWQVSATAIEDTPTLRIDRAGFEDALSENPEIARGLIRQLIRRLRSLAG